MSLKGKVALVTGSAQGIGKSVAARLAKDGADVIISDVNLDLAKSTAEEMQKLGVKSSAYKLDVSNAEEVKTVAAAIVKEFGKIDILVNNAGITKDGLMVRMKEEDFEKVIQINLNGVFYCIKAVGSYMMKQRAGRIINISSIVGLMGNAGQVNYSASKAGVLGMTKTLARELASRNINVNAVAPGFIDTAMTQKLPEDVKTKMLEQIPLAKLGQPEDIAAAVSFLSGDDSNYITGQVLSVNGGMYM